MNLNPIPKLKQFSADANRMLSISYKPGMNEFKRTLKIVLLGTIVLGIMGYIISIVVGIIV
ncbi:MAG: protein translocase SEC61 complex subunit gamma [Candidatus Micrarchaeota archaeon]|nr:protein translocase SEC61 complex subunit gamma [Candidatus Micrarchaeota archaeon]